MADIVNRSPFIVDIEPSSKKNPHAHLAKQFPYKQKAEAVSYAATLMGQGLQPRITQLETSFQVRIREKGVAAKTLTFPSFAEADQHVTKRESDQKVGLYRDYTEGARTTTAVLIQRYILEECPGLKGGDNYIIMLKAMLEDSENKLRQRINAHSHRRHCTKTGMCIRRDNRGVRQEALRPSMSTRTGFTRRGTRYQGDLRTLVQSSSGAESMFAAPPTRQLALST